ncbi:MAG: ferredoxin [Bacillota bacterium]
MTSSGRGSTVFPAAWGEDDNYGPSSLHNIETSECAACGTCEALCPAVFKMNEDLGYAEVIDPNRASEEEIHEAIDSCPHPAFTVRKNSSGPSRPPSGGQGSHSTPASPWLSAWPNAAGR